MIGRPLLRSWRRAGNRVRLVATAGQATAFLASYPKSGRTWFRFILANYFNRVGGLGLAVDLHNMFAVLPNFDFDPARGLPGFRFAGDPRVPLVPVSHQSYRRFLFRGRPMIFMVRDPRDLMVSAYFHATRHKHRFAGDITSFLHDPAQGLPNLIAYLNGWAAGLARHPHLVLSYERLSADPEGVTAQALRFLDRPVDTSALREAVAASRFEAMRDLELAKGIPAHSYDRSDSESLRMRRGEVGGFADYLRPEEAALVETACAAGLVPAAQALFVRAADPAAAG